MNMKHPGFKAVQAHIAHQKDHEGHMMGMERAGAILASRTRKASMAARVRNPRLKRVKG